MDKTTETQVKYGIVFSDAISYNIIRNDISEHWYRLKVFLFEGEYFCWYLFCCFMLFAISPPFKPCKTFFIKVSDINGDSGLSAYEILKIATRGGADVLGRPDTGRLDLNKCADIILFDLNKVEYAGCHDPLVSLVCLGNSSFTKMTVVNGRIVCKDGVLLTVKEEDIFHEAHAIAKDIVHKERERS